LNFDALSFYHKPGAGRNVLKCKTKPGCILFTDRVLLIIKAFNYSTVYQGGLSYELHSCRAFTFIRWY